ncbi:Rho termination factor N-terminal domain-containing protein, partial [Luedemannella flava]|uniref:Rho termination factor N-terminal domain-containing protein n=1 Tax=Luedemannella flava TaxID=349316 RepID=UPI0031DB4746
MSDTTDVTSEAPSTPETPASETRRRSGGGGLTGKLLPELQSMASSLGITGTARMRKSELIAAIQAQQNGESRVPGPRSESARGEVAARGESPRAEVRAEVRGVESEAVTSVESATQERAPRRASRAAGPPESREARAARAAA